MDNLKTEQKVRTSARGKANNAMGVLLVAILAMTPLAVTPVHGQAVCSELSVEVRAPWPDEGSAVQGTSEESEVAEGGDGSDDYGIVSCSGPPVGPEATCHIGYGEIIDNVALAIGTPGDCSGSGSYLVGTKMKYEYNEASWAEDRWRFIQTVEWGPGVGVSDETCKLTLSDDSGSSQTGHGGFFGDCVWRASEFPLLYSEGQVTLFAVHHTRNWFSWGSWGQPNSQDQDFTSARVLRSG